MSVRKGKLEYNFGLYLNADGQRVFGRDGAEILEALEEYGSIAAAAKKLQISYRFTWNCLVRMTRSLHQPVVVRRRGTTRYAGSKGGGGTTLTPVARVLLQEFRETERFMQQTLSRRENPATTSVTVSNANRKATP
jgi:molybdate transport repressor ModE-like protein